MKTLAPKPETEVRFRTQALDDLQAAWKSLRRLENLSDCPRERKSAGSAVSLLDKAFHELERGSK